MQAVFLGLFLLAPLCVLANPATTKSSAQSSPLKQTREIHSQIAPSLKLQQKQAALTLDACSGTFDKDLIQFLIQRRIRATLFVTKRWLVSNPNAVAILQSNLDLFQIENHGENHIPAVIGIGKKVYGIAGHPDSSHLQRELLEGARAIERLVGVKPKWYRAATAIYDNQSIEKIKQLGFNIAGFSVNADAGATLSQAQIERRLARVKNADVIIAHMNQPKRATGKALTVGLWLLLKQDFQFVRLDEVTLVEK
jgi:peptidoglycan/xylan/chitin deacetylase (PgdA/CDA1 family)